MGNSFGCSGSGERLVSAARDGDLVEARMLLEFNPCLAKYSTFGGLNSPLHFAAAKGHNEIVTLLLEHGADVNSRNYCGQTALMHACRYGHWEVVQTLLLYRANVTRADYLSGRTALHFAAVNGHVRCIRLVVADFIPSAPYESTSSTNDDQCDRSSLRSRYDQYALSKFVNKAADGGITALHMAALNGHSDCVQLLLDIHANVSSVTFHYGASMDLIGAGSTPLHYAACGGNLKCCQILLSRRASRLTLNCNGWLPLDVARIWGRHCLEPLLAPISDLTLPTFPPSNFLSLPLMSILNIARECGLQSTSASSDDGDLCAVCLERVCTVAADGHFTKIRTDHHFSTCKTKAVNPFKHFLEPFSTYLDAPLHIFSQDSALKGMSFGTHVHVVDMGFASDVPSIFAPPTIIPSM
ncbi:E3 ubiquitin-protein ligase XBAT33 isoform X3 [Amborella trichopoda]|uniref:E3 ubiquitin-protein ligase XBAT33 isoform X3 n=1 Tax=Amborella trichopoda TaxID=13333 RepID=UPI0009BEA83A|nr:E3 ubiquitin-protein ligase XBAT33 isoform X3 [Amborella trichopoda]|eukprot:XP_020531410.1 E3 ubiquitin-protein ligase XBAT33 isoform X3 [Amborella trichopoda]